MRAWLLVPLLGVAALGIAALDGDSGLRTWWLLRRDLRSSQETLDRLTAETERLRLEAHALETDPFALERAIREDLGWARPGEVVVLFGASEGVGVPADDRPTGSASGSAMGSAMGSATGSAEGRR